MLSEPIVCSCLSRSNVRHCQTIWVRLERPWPPMQNKKKEEWMPGWYKQLVLTTKAPGMWNWVDEPEMKVRETWIASRSCEKQWPHRPGHRGRAAHFTDGCQRVVWTSGRSHFLRFPFTPTFEIYVLYFQHIVISILVLNSVSNLMR